MIEAGPSSRLSRFGVRTRFFRLASGFWSGPTKLVAIALTIGVGLAMLATLGTQVAINAWHRTFFDALEARNWAGMKSAIWLLPLIVVAYAGAMTGLFVVRMTLQVRWRKWVTDQLLSKWIAGRRYYRLQISSDDPGAPEYRIAEDTRLAIDQFTDLFLGFVTALASGLAFAAILWKVAGSITIPLGGGSITIPAYMAVGAVVYAAFISTLIYWVGRPLVGRMAFKNEREARFRAEMTRLRENSSAVPEFRRDPGRYVAIGDRFRDVLDAWYGIIRRQGLVGIVLNTNGAVFPLLPVLLVAPKYLSGALTLGAVMQVVAAFTAVQAALIWFVDNFVRIAEWYASVVRVDELIASLEAVDHEPERPEDEAIAARQGVGAVALAMRRKRSATVPATPAE